LASNDLSSRIVVTRSQCEVTLFQMTAALPDWSLAPVVKAIQAMRGVSLITARHIRLSVLFH
jgi:hypothetical protein